MSNAVWKMKDFDKELAGELAYECQLPRPIANVLAGRDINTKELIEEFIKKDGKKIRSPRGLPDCQKAVDRIKKAIESKEKIFIWGDYDVDGITSTSIVVTVFKLLGADFVYKVPNRFDDGYDIKRHSVDECLKAGCTLLMSVDCGIVAFDTADYAKEKNLDLIITDHHSPNDNGTIPNALAVVNPSRLDSEYGFSGLCGAAVAFKLMLALAKDMKFDLNTIVEETLEYVALGTVADVAPMMDENRILVHKGCAILGQSKKPGIQELLKVAGVNGAVDSTTIGFQIGPRMNAIGRLEDPMIAVELMLETSVPRAKYLANLLDTANKRRQTKQEHMFQEAIALVEEQKLYENSAIVCWAKSWHQGLIGLVAGKLAEKYQKPAIVLALNEEGKAKGSCRSTRTINILQILKHPDVINLYSKKLDGAPIVGGHAFAAGMEVPESNLKEFRQRIGETLLKLNPDFAPGVITYLVDSRIVPGELSDNVFEALSGLAPFGSGHPEPIFWVKNLYVEEQKLLSSDKHLKLIVSDKGIKFKKVSALIWHRAKDFPDTYAGKKVDLLFTFGKESLNFGQKFYLNVVDIKLSE